MRTRLMARLLLLLLLLTALQPSGADDRAVRTELAALYVKIAQATREKNVAAIMQFTTEDYQQKGLNGKTRSRAAMLEDQKQTYASAQSLSLKVDITQLTVKGGTAVATVRWAVQIVTKPEVDPERKTHRIEAVVPLKQTWKKMASGWKLQRADELAGGTLTIDGKPRKIQRS